MDISSINDSASSSSAPQASDAFGVGVAATGNPLLDGLLTGYKWNTGAISYNFPTSAAYYDYYAGNGGYTPYPNGFVAVSSTFQAMVTKALGEFAAVANMTFTQVASNAASDISVARTTALGRKPIKGTMGFP